MKNLAFAVLLLVLIVLSIPVVLGWAAVFGLIKLFRVNLEPDPRSGKYTVDLPEPSPRKSAKIALLVAVALAAVSLLSVPTHADELVDYTLTVTNAPGDIGNVSWTIQTDGFIEPVPPMTFNSEGQCTDCQSNYFTSFVSESSPSNGDGCGITQVFLAPNYSTTTFFSPLCLGAYDALTAGVLPEPGELGTWSWQGTNPDETQNYVTLTVTDPPGMVP